MAAKVGRNTVKVPIMTKKPTQQARPNLLNATAAKNAKILKPSVKQPGSRGNAARPRAIPADSRPVVANVSPTVQLPPVTSARDDVKKPERADEEPEEVVPDDVANMAASVNATKEEPSPEQQMDAVVAIRDSTSLKAGQKAYLVSKKWYDGWSQYVGLSYASMDDEWEDKGRIDNSALLEKGGALREGLLYYTDYTVVVKGVWDLLVGWYGGGPTVQVDIEYDDSSMKNVAVVEKHNYVAVYGGVEKTFTTLVPIKVKKLRQQICKLFDVEDGMDTRLVDYWNGSPNGVMDDAKYLSAYNVGDDEQILLDEKAATGKWKSEAKQKKTTHSSYQYSYGYNDTPKGPGMVGLRNLGNTCFFNSGVQCLTHIMSLVNVFLNTNWEVEINETNRLGTGGKVVRVFGDIVRDIWSGKHGVIEPSELKQQIGEFAPQFSGWEQHDSQELVTYMLDAIHEDLNRCKEKPLVDVISGDSTNDEEIAAKSWENHKLRNDSVIVDRFHGQLRSNLCCPVCSQVTVVFDPYLVIPLPLQKGNFQSVDATFIPLDPKAAKIKIHVNVPVGATPEMTSKVVSKCIGKDVNVALCTMGYGGKIDWGLDADASSYSYRSSKYYMFEIGDSSHFWIPCGVMAKKTSTYSTYQQDETMFGPFLLPCKDDEISLDELAENAEKHLSWMWDASASNARALTDEEERFKKSISIVASKVTASSGDRKIKASVQGHYGAGTGIVKDEKMGHVSTQLVSLSLLKEDDFDVDSVIQLLFNETEIDAEEEGGNSKLTLKGCFDMFTEKEVLDEQNQWYCPKCKQFVSAEKKTDLWFVPDVMVIQLKRFIAGSWATQKIDTAVDYPDEINMRSFIVGPQKDADQIYKLGAVSEHIGGGIGGGHYTAHALVQSTDGEDKWCDFNDSSVSEVNASDAHTSLAYVLFYVREGSKDSIMNQWTKQS